MNDKLLIMTVGLPRSGKSTWAKKQSCPIVNPDSIRLGLHGQAFVQLAEPFVWAIAKVMVRALFLAGHYTVILDATNTTKARRKDWVCDDWVTHYKLFSTSKDECSSRAYKGCLNYLIPIIEDMAEKWEDIDEEEENLIKVFE